MRPGKRRGSRPRGGGSERGASGACGRFGIGRAVAIEEPPAAGFFDSDEIVIGVGHPVAGGAVAHLQIDHLIVRLVDEPMGVARAGREARAHAGCEEGGAGVRVQGGMAGNDVDEFILLGVGMPQGRHRTGLEHHPVHAEVTEAEDLPERPLLPPSHPGGEVLGIQRWALPQGRILGLDRVEGAR